MWHRVGILLRARLSAGPRGGLPIAALLAQALIAATFCGMVRDRLPPFAYGVFALSIMAALVAIPLIGELGWLLRRNEAEEFVSALPVRARELRLARDGQTLTEIQIRSSRNLPTVRVFNKL